MSASAVQDFEIPLGLEAAKRHVERYFAQFSTATTHGPDGYRAETSAWPFAEVVLVTVSLTPYSETLTSATVSARAVGQSFDWGATKRLVRKLSKILVEPEWNWPLAGF